MKELTCIGCPNGCRLFVDDYESTLKVAGNKCNIGITYAESEIKNPLRTLTSTIKVESGFHRRCPVKTSIPIPKPLILEAVKQLNGIALKTPVKTGQVIVKNILNTGADIIATSSIKE